MRFGDTAETRTLFPGSDGGVPFATEEQFTYVPYRQS